MSKSGMCLAGVVFALAAGPILGQEQVHWVRSGAPAQTAEYVDVSSGPVPDPQVVPACFGIRRPAACCTTECMEVPAPHPKCFKVLPSCLRLGKRATCKQADCACCSDTCSACHHKNDLCAWLFYRVHPSCSGYACTWYPPLYTYFLDHHCNPGWDGWQPNCCHGTDAVQQGCCSPH